MAALIDADVPANSPTGNVTHFTRRAAAPPGVVVLDPATV